MATNSKKIAVVVIHGMGEQRPMETLWGFVDAAWTHDSHVIHPSRAETFAKPDNITGAFELRRVTTRQGKGATGRRVDFFEFYWAHLMRGNTLAVVRAWLAPLFLRAPSTVPRRLGAAWLVGLLVIAFAAAVTVANFLPAEHRPEWVKGWVWGTAAISAAVIGYIAARWLVPVAGDAARYFNTRPDDVETRQKIREAGINLLSKLAASGEYDRIVVVGHSLGSAVGYDVLNHLFGRIPREVWEAAHTAGSPAEAALAALEAASVDLESAAKRGDTALADARTAYRDAQRSYASALAAGGTGPWIMSDFVTMGSPLSKADVLLARSAADLQALIRRRQAPVNPPLAERNEDGGFSYAVDDGPSIPHHGAVFAPTIWTNIYFPDRWLWQGDIISGPVAPFFGAGILDVRVPIGARRFRHLAYWSEPASSPAKPWLRALRRALNLRLEHDSDLWGPQSAMREVDAAALTASATVSLAAPAIAEQPDPKS